jgi:sugar (pentulose or hexulose) kinase
MSGHVAVIDIGKTNAKLALVDPADLAEVAVITMPNQVRPGPPYPHFDTDAIWAFLLDGLAKFHAQHGIGAISIATHGASGALIGADGTLAAPLLDYEHPGPDALAAEYDALRPDFAETGSPRLPMGLNLGAQIHWQFAQDPGLRARTAAIVTHPQYWGHRLTGALACDVSSLGAHTDLWDPHQRQFSSLVNRLDIAELMAPARKPSDALGHILPDIAAATGLAPATCVYCGIHDSNASLLPHLLTQEAPFCVVSTGTWVIAMAIGGAQVALDPAKDTLVNVNAFGAPVPSARFMGGREFDLISSGQITEPTDDDITEVLRAGVMYLPSAVAGSGPFAARTGAWLDDEPRLGTGQRIAALSFYLALMTAHCTQLIVAAGPTYVEGPFARNRAYLQMLHAVTARPVRPMTSSTGTSQGAALLVKGVRPKPATPAPLHSGPPHDALLAYAARWHTQLGLAA